MNIPAWLHARMVSVDAYDTEALLDGFLREMADGLDGKPSSLAMIPAYVSTRGVVPVGKPVAVIDAGGTNLRTGLALFSADGAMDFSHVRKQAIPGRDAEASAADFYAVLVDALAPMAEDFDTVGFCFSYPAAIMPDHDGVLMHWTKEIKIPELVGARIGRGLLSALEARSITNKNVVILNDTVAALLAGQSVGVAFNAASYVGLILGTGTNTAYVEQNRNIRKVEGLSPAGSQVINVESGGYAALERGEIDLALDASSENPGAHVFEKLISGVYMGPLALRLIQALALEGGVSGGAARIIADTETLSTIAIDNLCADNGRDVGIFGSDRFSGGDREVVKTVFRAVVERAAMFAAVNIAAAVVKSGGGEDSNRPVCVTIDGSTYYKTHGMADAVQTHLRRLLASRGRHVRCVRIDDAPMVGAAMAGLATFE